MKAQTGRVHVHDPQGLATPPVSPSIQQDRVGTHPAQRQVYMYIYIYITLSSSANLELHSLIHHLCLWTIKQPYYRTGTISRNLFHTRAPNHGCPQASSLRPSYAGTGPDTQE